MASLVCEVLAQGEDAAWQRIALTVSPGVSALQAAAARAGAPLGHDFCAISLSDLLTPWDVIERRLEAAATADFVIALYNPASLRRRDGLARALAILRGARPPTTPVVHARSLGRAGESVETSPLSDFDPGTVDMLSLLIVGSSGTRWLRAAERRRAGLHAARLCRAWGRLVMTVHFIGAGPGAPDLITLRGLRLIRRCPVVLYAGSLVPAEVIAEAGDDAPVPPRVVDTAPLDLDAILAAMARAHGEGLDVARVHSGDPSFYGAIAEQIRRLRALGIDYDVTPGVPAFAAAAAALGQELTLPGVAQSVILTRTAVRASPMPPRESLAAFAATGATLMIHLSINNLAAVVRELAPVCGSDCPAVVAYRVSWPDQQIIRATLGRSAPGSRGGGSPARR